MSFVREIVILLLNFSIFPKYILNFILYCIYKFINIETQTHQYCILFTLCL
jgi:hypothetical protein